MNFKPSRLSLLAAAAAAMLAACGGGGGDTAVVAPPAVVAPSPIADVPLVPSVVSPYGAGTAEARTLAHLNTARTECGFGALTPDARLDSMATRHARYMVSTQPYGGNLGLSWHDELVPTNAWFTGKTAHDRAVTVGYLNSAMTNASVGEGIAPSPGGDFPGQIAPGQVYGLLNVPYHALDLLAPWQHVGIGIASGPDDRRPVSPFEALVLNYGSGRNTSGQLLAQNLPADQVLTWPCAATTGLVLARYGAEVPDPFPGVSRPIGTPFYVVARKGASLRLSGLSLTQLATGKSMPLLPARYSDIERLPDGNVFSSSLLMDWAFVAPSEALPAGRYRMQFTATVNGKPLVRSVEFTTRDSFAGFF
jgi:uncharacterized protein YkwD